MQLSEPLTVKHCLRQDDHSALHFCVYVVPIYLLFVPIFLHFLAEEYLYCRNILTVGHHQNVVVGVQHRIGKRHDNLFSAPYTRHNELQMRPLRHLTYRLSLDCRIDDDELPHVSMIVIRMFFHLQIGRFHEQFAQ